MRSVRDIQILENVPILVRAALNVVVENGKVVEDYRLRRALPTINYLIERGARVVLIGHIGEMGTETLAPVAAALGEMLGSVYFCDVSTGPKAREAVRRLARGQVLMLENLRRDKREVANDVEFAKELAALGDVFIEDAFDACHREHASIVELPKLLPSYSGLLLEDEVRELSSARAPQSPSLAIIGGAKFSTKEPVLKALLASYDKVFVGGALANDFLKAAGHGVGKSLISQGGEDKIKALLQNPKLVLPLDSVVSSDFKTKRVAGLDDVAPEEMILDHGPQTSVMLEELVAGAKTILWNGPRRV